MLDLYKLKIFMIVVQEGSFTAAAEQLYMTQSAVSQHIHELEGRLGVQLFQRGWRGVNVTSQGQTLYDYAHRIFGLVAEAENAVVDITQLTDGQIKLGATPGVGAYLLPDWVQQFRDIYPNLTFSIQTGTTPQIVKDLLALRLDMGFIEGEIDQSNLPRLVTVVLEKVEQFVVVGRNHPLWKESSVVIEALVGENFVMRPKSSRSRLWLDQFLYEHGIQSHIAAEYDNPESIKRAVASSTAIAILPDYVVRHEEDMGVLHRVALENISLQRDLKLAWEINTTFSAVTCAFMEKLSMQFPAIRDVLPVKGL